MSAGHDGKTNHVNSLLNGLFHDTRHSLVQTGINHFHSRILQSECDHLGTAIMSIESRFCHQDPYLSLRHNVSNTLQ